MIDRHVSRASYFFLAFLNHFCKNELQNNVLHHEATDTWVQLREYSRSGCFSTRTAHYCNDIWMWWCSALIHWSNGCGKWCFAMKPVMTETKVFFQKMIIVGKVLNFIAVFLNSVLRGRIIVSVSSKNIKIQCDSQLLRGNLFVWNNQAKQWLFKCFKVNACLQFTIIFFFCCCLIMGCIFSLKWLSYEAIGSEM
ncbi:hypothetical protein GJAV_G00099670 [Gymnothorax javanicus]|nr:hypothetical protein GJAV_G00099670 [Gymnothorax javanicus]